MDAKCKSNSSLLSEIFRKKFFLTSLHANPKRLLPSLKLKLVIKLSSEISSFNCLGCFEPLGTGFCKSPKIEPSNM